jgi:molybdenum cofactor synthesis domain-containing protein
MSRPQFIAPSSKEQTDKTFRRTVAIVTVSDRGARGEREDASGRALVERLESEGFQVSFQRVVPDETLEISNVLRECADEKKVALVVTTGGTGVSPRDVTPEATLAVVDRTVPGMAEAMRAKSLLKTPHAMISRAVVGIRCSTLIVNLPGSPRGAVENLEVLLPALPHALDKIQGDPSECAKP